MNAILLLNLALVFFGTLVLLFSLKPAARIVTELGDTAMRRYWVLLKYMIFMFILGYTAYFIISLSPATPPMLVVSLIFFLGAWFVFLVCGLTAQTVDDLHRMAKLEKEKVLPIQGYVAVQNDLS